MSLSNHKTFPNHVNFLVVSMSMKFSNKYYFISSFFLQDSRPLCAPPRQATPPSATSSHLYQVGLEQYYKLLDSRRSMVCACVCIYIYICVFQTSMVDSSFRQLRTWTDRTGCWNNYSVFVRLRRKTRRRNLAKRPSLLCWTFLWTHILTQIPSNTPDHLQQSPTGC